MSDIFGQNVVFFGAHTDDEMVCAGALHRFVREGRNVCVVSFTSASTFSNRDGSSYEASWKVLQPEWHASLDAIGVASREFVGLVPENDPYLWRKRACQYAFDYCENRNLDCAFILSIEDSNVTHSVVGEECERVMRGRVSTVIRCQFPWNYGLGRPNLYISLSPEDVEAKRKSMAAYKSQKFRYDYEAIFMSQAIADGESVKVRAAEKFEIVRSVL